MNLGTILQQDDGLPCAGRPVAFHLTKYVPGQRPKVYEVKAILYPVGEAQRHEAARAAEHYLRTAAGSPYKAAEGKPAPFIPDDALNAETLYRFLVLALCDLDGNRLVDEASYERFRQGLVQEQILWLRDEYAQLIKEEYPELMTEAEKAAAVARMAEQAAGK